MRVITARSNNILFNPAQFCLVPQWEQQTGGEGEAVWRKEIATPADGPVLAAEVRGRSLSARETPQTPEKLPWATATLPLPLPSSLWLGWNLRPFLTTAGRGVKNEVKDRLTQACLPYGHPLFTTPRPTHLKPHSITVAKSASSDSHSALHRSEFHFFPPLFFATTHPAHSTRC